jgi:uroporphyrinogen-III decarboxylase
MEGRPTPRQIAKGLLNGVVPHRPLFVPIVFSLGAKVENIPIDAFLSNPAKISSALRQMRGHLSADGVACYFDPCLEVEALGATLQRHSDGQSPTIHWAQPSRAGELPGNLRSPEEAAKSGRVPIVVEVIRRMNALPNRDFLLMAGVTGPLTLAGQLTQLSHSSILPEHALELAGSVVTQVASTLVEAGAELIVIEEAVFPASSGQGFDSWAGLLAPVINIVRFYEAVPVLQLNGVRSVRENWDGIAQRQWDGVVSLPLEVLLPEPRAESEKASVALLGIALPLEAFGPAGQGAKDLHRILEPMIPELRPALLTTAGDVPAGTDMKILRRVFGEVTRAR